MVDLVANAFRDANHFIRPPNVDFIVPYYKRERVEEGVVLTKRTYMASKTLKLMR